MKFNHFITPERYYSFKVGEAKNGYWVKEGGYKQIQLWLGSHCWQLVFKFKCKCLACQIKRRREWVAKWLHITMTDEELIRGMKWRGEKAVDLTKQALTQERFRAAHR